MKKAFLFCLFASVLSTSAEEDPKDIVRREFRDEGSGTQVWVYTRPMMAQGSVPCVLIAAAGTRMFHGMDLGEGDVPEHLPYVKAGLAVVAYSLSGPWPEDPVTDAGVLKAINGFVQAQGGLNNATAALRLAKEKYAFIDTTRVYAAGHSSAGVVALNLAQKMPGLRGCIAYAPATDLEQRYGEKVIAQLSTGVPGFRNFVQDNSPFRNAAQIQCPVMLFNARDDSKIPPETITAYAAELQKAGKTVKHVEVATGDHYDSMLNEGIPQGIEWLKKLEADGARK